MIFDAHSDPKHSLFSIACSRLFFSFYWQQWDVWGKLIFPSKVNTAENGRKFGLEVCIVTVLNAKETDQYNSIFTDRAWQYITNSNLKFNV